MKTIIISQYGGVLSIVANGQGLCVRAVIENINLKYGTNDK